jgi:hypothetical protein
VKSFFKRFLRNKRAITPVLSELLLTVIVVAAMSIATTATYVITTNLRENMSERVTVEDVWFNQATGTVNVYLQNVGKVDASVSSVYINHTSQPFDMPFHLEIDGHKWLGISFSWNSGDLYYVDIVTNRGTHIASYYKAT